MDWNQCPTRLNDGQCTLYFGHLNKFAHTTSNLVAHVQRELMIIGEEDLVIYGLMKSAEEFVKVADSGGAHSVLLPVFAKLLALENLTSLTDDPGEWRHHGPDMWGGRPEGVWQNIRNTKAFSEDGGATYHLVGSADWNEIHYSKPTGESETKTEGGDENGGNTGDGDRPDASAPAADRERSAAREPGAE